MNTKNWTIRKRLLCIVGLNVVMAVMVICIAWHMTSTFTRTQSTVEQQQASLRQVVEIDTLVDTIKSDVLEVAVLVNSVGQTEQSRETVLRTMEKHVAAAEAALRDASKGEVSDALRQQFQTALENLKEYEGAARSVVADIFNNPNATSDAAHKLDLSHDGISNALHQITTQLEGYLKRSKEEGQTASNRAATALLLTLAVFVTLGVVIPLLVSRSLGVSLSAIIESVTRGTERVGSMNGSLQVISKGVAESATEQAAAVQESVASMDEMTSMICQTGENARKSLDIAQRVTERTEEGSRIMEQMVTSMESIQQGNRQLLDMAEIIREISAKTAVINDIVFKTQLLAFNASIEAARAGQHGRGFAVVAEEVGNLADTSGLAAKEIQVLLEDSQRQVSKIVEDTQRRVSEGQSVSRQAMATFASIAKEIYNISSQIQGINDATREQELGVRQTSIAMEEMDRATQRNSDNAGKAARAVEDMSYEIVELKKVEEELKAMVYGGQHWQARSLEGGARSEERPHPRETVSAVPNGGLADLAKQLINGRSVNGRADRKSDDQDQDLSSFTPMV